MYLIQACLADICRNKKIQNNCFSFWKRTLRNMVAIMRSSLERGGWISALVPMKLVLYYANIFEPPLYIYKTTLIVLLCSRFLFMYFNDGYSVCTSSSLYPKFLVILFNCFLNLQNITFSPYSLPLNVTITCEKQQKYLRYPLSLVLCVSLPFFFSYLASIPSWVKYHFWKWQSFYTLLRYYISHASLYGDLHLS